MAKKRIFAALVAGLIIVAMLTACVFIALEEDHDCTGEDCHICAQLNVCRSVLRPFLTGLFVATLCTALLTLLRPAAHPSGAAAFPTLVSLKILLLD